jgi:hypothetical protein
MIEKAWLSKNDGTLQPIWVETTKDGKQVLHETKPCNGTK